MWAVGFFPPTRPMGTRPNGGLLRGWATKHKPVRPPYGRLCASTRLEHGVATVGCPGGAGPRSPQGVSTRCTPRPTNGRPGYSCAFEALGCCVCWAAQPPRESDREGACRHLHPDSAIMWCAGRHTGAPSPEGRALTATATHCVGLELVSRTDALACAQAQ